jgi:acrylyl-CoA reductase (NADPH)/3-hydroxypropionyl-CoA dehydratase/3-hydroxypropionyl-CoA synthetase
MLTSEVNFNDIWALTGIPVSPFDSHEEDVQITGSGGIALVAALGSETRAQGRIKVGDLVTVYSGTNDLLSPLVGNDPMYADFSIQGYETETGSHAQFLTVQAPQMHKVPPDLTLEQAGSYVLNLGTIARCLFTTLQIAPGRTLFVEGAATGTGLDALRSSVRTGLQVTGLVSSEERASFITQVQGAIGAINRKDARFADLYSVVPEDKAEAQKWEAAGAALVKEFKALNGGKLADYVVSHAGETAFPRSFQLLAENGTLAFYGASSGYHFSFMGKPGTASPEEMLRRAALRGGEAVLIYYGPGRAPFQRPLRHRHHHRWPARIPAIAGAGGRDRRHCQPGSDPPARRREFPLARHHAAPARCQGRYRGLQGGGARLSGPGDEAVRLSRGQDPAFPRQPARQSRSGV